MNMETRYHLTPEASQGNDFTAHLKPRVETTELTVQERRALREAESTRKYHENKRKGAP